MRSVYRVLVHAALPTACISLLLCSLLVCTTPLAAAEKTRVLIVVGPSTHPPGTHEVAAGGRLVAYCLKHAENVSGIEAKVVSAWPDDPKVLEGVASVVFTGDQFPPERMKDSERIMADLSKMMDRGCGIVCIHYATGLTAGDVAKDGAHPLLAWLGGYFATRCEHHQSVARIYREAKIEPGEKPHPVLRGWKPFTVHDEPYIKNYFGQDGPGENVTPLANSMLPPEHPQREIVAWAVSRKDGGRGMGIVMPHFFRNWKQDDLRTLILNGVVWSAGLEVPAEGVKTTLPDLATFQPAAVEPRR